MTEMNAALSSQSETEQKLTGILQAVLGRADVGINDDFLALGGDSLSAMLCISRVREEYGVNLPVEEFFIPPASVARLASVVDGQAPDKIATNK